MAFICITVVYIFYDRYKSTCLLLIKSLILAFIDLRWAKRLISLIAIKLLRSGWTTRPKLNAVLYESTHHQ